MAANLGLDLADPNLTLADVEALVERAKKFGAPPETPTGARDVQGRSLLMVEIVARKTTVPAAPVAVRKPGRRAPKRAKAAPSS